MTTFIAKILLIFKRIYISTSTLIKNSNPQHTYRVLHIEKDESDNYIALIQIVNKNQIFRIHPEEILVNNNMVNLFSQKDVRALTYLGYLGMNGPKYTILAKKLSEQDNKLIFAIKERGNKNPLIKTADQISSDKSLLKGLHQQDAHMIGYAVAAEQIIEEQIQKKKLIAEIKNNEDGLIN